MTLTQMTFAEVTGATEEAAFAAVDAAQTVEELIAVMPTE